MTFRLSAGLMCSLLAGCFFLLSCGEKKPPAPAASPEPTVRITTGTVMTGDTFARILSAQGINGATIVEIERNLRPYFRTTSIQPGDEYRIEQSTTGVFQTLFFRTDPIHSYRVTLSSEGVWGAGTQEEKTEWKPLRVRGEIRENLYKDLLSAGYDENFVANTVGDLVDNIFAWRIDFFTEQRPGDRFDILMEQEFIAGQKTPLWKGRGRILVATYNGKATKIKENIAIRYQAPQAKRADYYDPEGNAVRRAFLRAPFTQGAFRVSSGFNLKRFHPILRVYRPHHGTDYAAAVGTPVVAIGKGRVIRAEWYKGYGKCVDIRHNNAYVSRYGHLSRMSVKKGQSVEQGQRIGHVGSTGLSTGPHLHFEMLVNGSQRNFLRMNFPAASAVAKENRADFNRVRETLLSRLTQQAVASES